MQIVEVQDADGDGHEWKYEELDLIQRRLTCALGKPKSAVMTTKKVDETVRPSGDEGEIRGVC